MTSIVRILLDAGATPVSAARAAVVLEAGGSIDDARAQIVLIEEVPEEAAWLSEERRLPESNRWKVPVENDGAETRKPPIHAVEGPQ